MRSVKTPVFLASLSSVGANAIFLASSAGSNAIFLASSAELTLLVNVLTLVFFASLDAVILALILVLYAVDFAVFTVNFLFNIAIDLTCFLVLDNAFAKSLELVNFSGGAAAFLSLCVVKSAFCFVKEFILLFCAADLVSYRACVLIESTFFGFGALGAPPN